MHILTCEGFIVSASSKSNMYELVLSYWIFKCEIHQNMSLVQHVWLQKWRVLLLFQNCYKEVVIWTKLVIVTEDAFFVSSFSWMWILKYWAVVGWLVVVQSGCLSYFYGWLMYRLSVLLVWWREQFWLLMLVKVHLHKQSLFLQRPWSMGCDLFFF